MRSSSSQGPKSQNCHVLPELLMNSGYPTGGVVAVGGNSWPSPSCLWAVRCHHRPCESLLPSVFYCVLSGSQYGSPPVLHTTQGYIFKYSIINLGRDTLKFDLLYHKASTRQSEMRSSNIKLCKEDGNNVWGEKVLNLPKFVFYGPKS